MAAVDPLDSETSAHKRPDYVRSRYDRDGTRHKSGSYQKSGHVERHGQLTRWPDHIEQCLERGPQISDSFFRRCSIADCADARPDESGSAPDTVLVLLDGVGHMDVVSHVSIMHNLVETCRRRFPLRTSRDVLGTRAPSVRKTTGTREPSSSAPTARAVATASSARAGPPDPDPWRYRELGPGQGCTAGPESADGSGGHGDACEVRPARQDASFTDAFDAVDFRHPQRRSRSRTRLGRDR
jgi:hypothetical protein